ncbi:MAG: carboxypeptidase M32 [Planctomycetota bacterium]
MSVAYAALQDHLHQLAVVDSISSLTGWDQETYMPKAGSPLRAEQRRYLSKLSHERASDPRLGELLEACERDAELMADAESSANIREVRRDYDRAVKLPVDLVEQIAESSSLGMNAWREARATSDFSAFLPWLRKTVELNQRKADCLTGTPGTGRYDALLDTFEPGMTAARVQELFAPLRTFTVDQLERIRSLGVIDTSLLSAESPLDAQRALCSWVMDRVGFDFMAGRFDETTHPFCSGFGPGDTRLTNRYRADGWADSLTCALHEGGHGLYEQGLPKGDKWGLPSAEAISLGIHESQSRLWENQVGRSRAFITWLKPRLDEMLGGAVAAASVDELTRVMNVAEPGFIRVESDELTYNLHIMLRFDFERAMIEGELDPADLPGEWNARMKVDLGLDVPDDRRGCLQDVHWSMMAMGYFPTYTLGNMYAATWWDQIGRDLPERDAQLERGEFAPVLAWTRDNIHQYGRQFGAEQLCERITGSPLSPEPLMAYLREKIDRVYGE